MMAVQRHRLIVTQVPGTFKAPPSQVYRLDEAESCPLLPP